MTDRLSVCENGAEHFVRKPISQRENIEVLLPSFFSKIYIFGLYVESMYLWLREST